jgi:hypothetical protein
MAQERVRMMLNNTTSLYDGPGKTPPKDFEKEKGKIMYVQVLLCTNLQLIYGLRDSLKFKLEYLGETHYQSRMEIIVVMALLNPSKSRSLIDESLFLSNMQSKLTLMFNILLT